jgi:FtsP/CotA-like multicopper oxidase with cupredoxin domain
MSTHWFHDHMLDFTATNVYKGNAAMFNMYSAMDRGREPASAAEAKGDAANPGYGCHYANPDNVNLCLPSGSDLDWGNRDYDINLFIKGIAWDGDGQLWFNIFNTDGMLGDRMVINWLFKPYLDVRARRYRFRILNGAVSRYFKLAIVEKVEGDGGELAGPPGSNSSYNRVPFYMVANDGNLMEHAVYFDGKKTVNGYTNRRGILPTQSIAERYDIVVDFAGFDPGTKLYMLNLLEHKNGRRPNRDSARGCAGRNLWPPGHKRSQHDRYDGHEIPGVSCACIRRRRPEHGSRRLCRGRHEDDPDARVHEG